MKILVDIIKSFLIGVGISFLLFMGLYLSNYFIEDKSNLLESQMYIEALELYKLDIVKNISWTKVFEKAFSPRSIVVSAISHYDSEKVYMLSYPYEVVDHSYPMYLIQKGETIFSLRFKEALEIRVWK